jgi:uncharacterized protein (DUF1330 family)
MPKGLIYAEIEITDQAEFREYAAIAHTSVTAFGGTYIVRGGDPKALEGDHDFNKRTVVLTFDSPERALEWYNSPMYAPMKAMRIRSTNSKLVLYTENEQ